jgi:hypothetical protein
MIEMIQDYLSTLMNKYKFTQQSTPQEINEIINGSYRIKHAVIDKSITVNGQAILGEEVLVKEKMVINGSLISKHVNFESDLEANGTASLVDSKNKGNAFFSGNLSAKNSIFTNSINLLANKSEFDHCQIDSLMVQAIPIKNSKQKILLTNGTTIAGDILFQSGIGKVYVDATSIVKGHIVGGVLVKVSN